MCGIDLPAAPPRPLWRAAFRGAAPDEPKVRHPLGRADRERERGRDDRLGVTPRSGRESCRLSLVRAGRRGRHGAESDSAILSTGGPVAAAMAHLLGESPDQQLAEDLGRFKEIIEKK